MIQVIFIIVFDLLEFYPCLFSDGMGWLGSRVVRIASLGRVDADPDSWGCKLLGTAVTLAALFAIAKTYRIVWPVAAVP